MRYRLLQRKDIAEIWHLGKETFASPAEYSWDWSKKEIGNYLKKSYGFGIVALERNTLAGFILICSNYASQRPRVAWLTFIFVQKKYRQQGIASELLARGTRRLKSANKDDLIADIYLENKASIRFFQNHDFQIKETWFILSRKLKK